MNELQEQILALLVAKFQGVRKDGLQHLVENIKSLDPLLYSHLTHQKYIRIK